MQIGQLVFGLAGLLALVAFMPPLAGRLRLPYSVLLALIGFALGILLHLHAWAPKVMSDFFDTLQAFKISSETFLYVFLPILLFETSLSMNLRRLLDDIGPILMMAVVAVVVCTFAVGYALNAASTYGLVVCLMLGAIVATTDPVAVVGVFREVGAPKRLSTLVEGEALFNDAASIALYSVLLAVLTGGGALSGGTVLNSFLISFLGGALAGYLMGRLASSLFVLLGGWPSAEVTLTVALDYLAFFVSEHYLGVSGVVATVISGLVVGSTGRTRMSPATFELLTSSWAQMGFLANSLIFLFAAMLIPRMMAEMTWTQVGLIGLLFVVTLLARAVMVFGVLPLLGRTRFGTRVSRPYRMGILWGGLRGAVSLALALAVTEQHAVPHEVRQFIGVATTGFVLLTLFVNGMTLRPLIHRLGLDQLTPLERHLRDQAVSLALEDLRDKTEELARQEKIKPQVTEHLCTVFDASQASVASGQIQSLTEAQKIKMGMAMLSAREVELFYELLKSQIVDWKTAESLLSRAERMNDTVRQGGLTGFESAIAADLRYSYGFRWALRLHYLMGVQGWLARELAKRFANLIAKRSVAERLIRFARTELPPLLGQQATETIVQAHQLRLTQLEDAMHSLTLQYPVFAQWLQESYLARIAASQERARYREMLSHSLITGEMYADLVKQINQRWRYLDKRPALDIAMSASELISRVPLFDGIPDETKQRLAKRLRPRLALPDQKIHLRFGGMRAMYFVASGAVETTLPDGSTVELGTGETIGEVNLVEHTDYAGEVRSLGYSRLLMLTERDFDALLAKAPLLREKIETVVRQRQRAYQVWKEFESGQRKHEPLPPLFGLAQALSQAESFVGPLQPGSSIPVAASAPAPH
ncbi:cation:proton antiporter [Alcaligenes sp. Marseille-Q7550]